jgi:excinuclease ABC subunit C
MLESARRLDWIVLRSELEALLTEAAMVRAYKPRFNIMLRDDKRFPLLLLTDEPWPRLIKVRRARRGAGRHFGPFRGETAAHLMEIVSRRFRIRRCEGPLPKRQRPCIDHEIARCDAPCVRRTTREVYAEEVEAAARLLVGDVAAIIREMKDEMASASAAREFEQAAGLRDEIAALGALKEKQDAERPTREDADAIGVALAGETAIVAILARRGGAVAAREIYSFETPIECDPGELAARAAIEHYRERVPPPNLLLVDPGMVEAWAKAKLRSATAREAAGPPYAGLEGRRPRRPPGAKPPDHEAKAVDLKIAVRTPQRGADAALLGMAEENAIEALRVSDAARHLAFRNAALDELIRVLGLENPPTAIEGFDISTFSGKDTVASCVHFRDGRPRKTGYRLYRIKGRQDSDVDAMAEVLARRATSRDPLPDLILIDGGMGQLMAAREALVATLGADVMLPPMIGLEKREELIRTLEGEVIDLPAHSAALRLLQQVRDEAHRFGREYHRKRRAKNAPSFPNRRSMVD